MRLRKPSPAMLVALLALFVALGGSSYAAFKLPRNSVGPRQIKADAVTSAKVKGGSLLLSDFERSQLRKLAGAQGPQGLQGPKGDAGDAGATHVVVRTMVGSPISTGELYVLVASCHAGEHAISGGGGFNGNAGREELQQSYPLSANGARAQEGTVPTAWFSIVRNDDNGPLTPIGYVVCAQP